MTFFKECLRFEFGERVASDLPNIALLGLEEGLDTKSLRVLAGCLDDRTMSTSELLFIYGRVLSELGVAVPARREIALHLIEDELVQILNRSVHPYEGARRIVSSLLHEAERPGADEHYLGESFGLEHLCALRYSYDDVEEAIHPLNSGLTNQQLLLQIEQDILDEAERLLREKPWTRREK